MPAITSSIAITAPEWLRATVNPRRVHLAAARERRAGRVHRPPAAREAPALRSTACLVPPVSRNPRGTHPLQHRARLVKSACGPRTSDPHPRARTREEAPAWAAAGRRRVMPASRHSDDGRQARGPGLGLSGTGITHCRTKLLVGQASASHQRASSGCSKSSSEHHHHLFRRGVVPSVDATVSRCARDKVLNKLASKTQTGWRHKKCGRRTSAGNRKLRSRERVSARVTVTCQPAKLRWRSPRKAAVARLSKRVPTADRQAGSR